MASHAQTIPSGPQALEIFLQERNFLNNHVRDTDGGFAFWVERDGAILDPRKFAVFQANIILWTGGVESQRESETNKEMIRSAAEYLLANLYKGDGEWFEYVDPATGAHSDFTWNPPHETYIAYALFEAYRVLDDVQYLEVAQATTARQRQEFPNGHIYSRVDGEDIGYRFPEHMGHYEEYVLTGNPDALAYASLFEETYRGQYAYETTTDIFGEHNFYHGTAVVDKLLYSYLANNDPAYADATELRAGYWAAGHDDAKTFTDDRLGEISDNGRDYYDKRVALDLVEWSRTGEEKFREDALKHWDSIITFWDVQDPFGFFINSKQTRKTCFTISQPGLMMDLTAPTVLDIDDQEKAFWNHQVTMLIVDPPYKWNDHVLRGIGIDKETIDVTMNRGVPYGAMDVQPGSCQNCYQVTFNYLAFYDDKLDVHLFDFYNNFGIAQQSVHPSFAIFSWGNLNLNSVLYYVSLFTILWCLILITLLVTVRIARRIREP